jgi:hypothetical protein
MYCIPTKKPHRHTRNSTKDKCITHNEWPKEDNATYWHTLGQHTDCSCCWCERSDCYFSKLPADITHNLLRDFICRGGGPQPPPFVRVNWYLTSFRFICNKCLWRHHSWHKFYYIGHLGGNFECRDGQACARRLRAIERRERLFFGTPNTTLRRSRANCAKRSKRA